MTVTAIEPILLRVEAGKGPRVLADYRRDRGMDGLASALAKTPEEVVTLVREARLRGRGGAGFPAGDKWSFVPRDTGGPVYLIANADEGEPGTFKDRELMTRDPHALLEGMVIAGYAIGASLGVIYLRGEYDALVSVLEDAIVEGGRGGTLGENILGYDYHFDVVLFSGAGSYVCGEETALLESLEGKRGQPRLRPPFPAEQGLYGRPTIVQNVETLCCLPFILREGAEAFRAIGPNTSPGPKLFSISGGVRRPGVYERPMGIRLLTLIEEAAGGLRCGRQPLAVFPGGLSSPLLTADELDVAMDFDSLAAAGSTLGSGGVIVLDEQTDLREVLRRGARFYADESCGQCAPCREGTAMLVRLLERDPWDAATLALLSRLSRDLKGLGICPLNDAAAILVGTAIQKLGVVLATT